MTTHYHISVEFYVDQVQQLKPEWSLARCQRWLDENEEEILQEAEEAGVNCMEDLLVREEEDE